MDFNFFLFFVGLAVAFFGLAVFSYGWMRGIFSFVAGIIFIVLGAMIAMGEPITVTTILDQTTSVVTPLDFGISISGFMIFFFALGIAGIYMGAET